MVSFDPIVRVLDGLTSLIEGKPDLRWAVVTQISPLRIRLDADENELLATPDTLVSPLLPGERVRVALQNRRVTVLGVAGRRTGLRGTTAQRELVRLSGAAQDGLNFFDTDESLEYIFLGSQWRLSPVTPRVLSFTPRPGWEPTSGFRSRLTVTGLQVTLETTLWLRAAGDFNSILQMPPEVTTGLNTFIGAFVMSGSSTRAKGMLQLNPSGLIFAPAAYREGSTVAGDYLPVVAKWTL